MPRWAVFDVDGTLLPGTSMEKMFLRFMLGQGILPLRNIFYYLLAGGIKIVRQNPAEAFKNNKYYLKDLPEAPVKRAAAQFIRQRVWPDISRSGLARVENCRDSGFKILLMSGSPDFLTRPLAAVIQPDAVITAEMEVRHGCFSGRLAVPHPYGRRKTALLKARQKELGLDFRASLVFANHPSDAHHMRLFGRAVAVNPAPRLKSEAVIQGWPVESWR